ncbi:nitroreductase [Flammeovirga pectinis]|uniref:Nitroreductase n=1 Tax=Flammeovirga pectinis TaxID=2494373 RepID=A0A3Q9FM44_9BACT|nr:nitroreductase [Flammeovirga pectinis]AZQ61797.1 nitroreductase [Flammeovirga pectinis]
MTSEISAIIKERRSFYPHEFIKGEIPKKDIDSILENANWAPNHGMTEPWRFFVFSGKGLQSSHVIAIIMQRGNNKKIPVLEEVEAVACAVQNMALTVTDLGYGAYWSTGGMVKFKEAKEFFGLREEDQLLGLFYIGKVVTTKKDSKRGAITDKVTWVNE